MRLVAFLKVAFCTGTWMVAAFAIPVALIALPFGIYLPTYILLCYYSFRFLFPAKFWPAFVVALNLNSPPYCNEQNVIIEEGVEYPTPDSKSMVALSPHGILTIGWMTLISSPQFRDLGFRFLVAEILSSLPFLSDINAWSNVVSCAKDNMIRYMSAGINVALIPGGFEECTLYKRGRHRVFLRNRKGFIKYALQYGYKVYPVYVFGEERTYWQLDMPEWALWLNKYKIPTTLFIGKYCMLPDNNIEINVVVGKPLQCPEVANPSSKEVDAYHAKFMQSLEELFERNKVKYGNSKDTKLEIF